MFIAVAGNIGAGKTTLTELLARHYGWEPKYEAVATNPYMEDYYKDIHRWSFCLETFFLKERFRDLLAISQTDKDVIQDRSIFEGVHVHSLKINLPQNNITYFPSKKNTFYNKKLVF